MNEQGYRVPEVTRVVGITYRQLDYWARTGLVTPSKPGHPRIFIITHYSNTCAAILPGNNGKAKLFAWKCAKSPKRRPQSKLF